MPLRASGDGEHRFGLMFRHFAYYVSSFRNVFAGLHRGCPRNENPSEFQMVQNYVVAATDNPTSWPAVNDENPVSDPVRFDWVDNLYQGFPGHPRMTNWSNNEHHSYIYDAGNKSKSSYGGSKLSASKRETDSSITYLSDWHYPPAERWWTRASSLLRTT
jgi:hypothetical protein